MKIRLLPVILLVGGALTMGKVYAANSEETKPTDAHPSPQEQSQATPSPKTEEQAKPSTTVAPDSKAKTAAPPPPEEPKEDTLDITEFSPSELKVLQSLRARRESLAAREAAVEEKEKVLKGMEQRVGNKIEELEAIKSQIEQVRDEMLELSQKFKANEDKQIQSLVQVYEKMKPGDAAVIFNTLDMGVLMDVVKGMKEAKLALILAGMDPKRATEITETLGGRTHLPDIAKSENQEQVTAPDILDGKNLR
jgi:flagellar motility protein MotE (MotC chaperone)